VDSLHLSKIGTYGKLETRAELTGTGDTRLFFFGTFEPETTHLSLSQKSTTQMRDRESSATTGDHLPLLERDVRLRFLGGDFFLFAGPGSLSGDVVHTDVFSTALWTAPGAS
jgi:hypothetical protein